MTVKDGLEPNETEEVEKTAEGSEESESSNAFGLPDDHPAMKELAKVRREAASRREQRNQLSSELEEKAKKWEEYENSQKTEIQLAKEKAATLESQLQELRDKDHRRELAKDIMKEFELDADLQEVLVGDEDQMRAIAEKLAKKLKDKKPSSGDFLGGSRGNPVYGQKGEAPSAGANWLRTQI